MVFVDGIGRQYTGGIAGMNAGLFDMFHHAADDGILTVGNGVHIQLKGFFQELVNEHGLIRRGLDRQIEIFFKIFFIIDNFHGPAAQNKGGANHDRVSDIPCYGHGFFI